MRKILLSLAIIILSKSLYAASCASPISIPSTPYNSNTSGITTSCGQGNNVTGGQCATSYGGASEEDVVFTFTPTANGSYPISLTASATYGGLFFKTGSCIGACAGSVTTGFGTSASGNINLTAGVTYYIIFTTWTAPNCSSFTFTIGNVILPPANDNCSGAIALTVNPTTLCSSTTSGITTAGATQSTLGCTGTADDDIWYSFVATSQVQNISLVSATSIVQQVFSGSCAGLTSLSCLNSNTSSISNLTIGNTYYVRIYSSASGVTASNINFCVQTPPCTAPTTGGSTTLNTSGCPATYTMSFNITSLGTNSSANITNAGGYTVTPSTVSTVPTVVTIGPIPMGSNSSMTTLVGSAGCNRTIASQASPVCPPANDECSSAINLTVGTTCTYQTYTNAGATASFGAPTISCSSYSGGDVWFSVVVPAGGNLTIDTQVGVIDDGGMAVYSGICGSLTTITCDDDSSPNGFMPMVILTGRTPGETLYIRMFEYGNNNNGTFGICVKEPAGCTGPSLAGNATINTSGCPTTYSISYNVTHLGSATSYTLSNANGNTVTPSTVSSVPTLVTVSGITAGSPSGNTIMTHNSDSACNFTLVGQTGSCPPTNDECSNAINLSVASVCNYQTYTNAGATASSGAPAPGCANYLGGDIWFSVVVPASGNIILDSQLGVIDDSGMAVYSGSCGSLALVECDDDDSPNGNMSLISLTGRTPGETLYIRFWEYGNNNNGTFGICARQPVPPDPAPNCSAGNPTPDDECATAPVLNNPNGFCGATSSTYTAGSPNPTCGSEDNNSYLQFEASDVTLSISWWITGGASCTDGIQLAIFSGTCSSPTLVPGTCINPSGGTGSNGVWNINGLTIGTTYYLYIDGYAGDICDYVFAANSGVVLPMTLTEFKGVASQNKHYISWRTASERENLGFDLERSTDGVQFGKVVRVASKAIDGNSAIEQKYDFIVTDPMEGLTYYRLKQIDKLGKSTYSKVITLENFGSKNGIVQVFPNPASSKLSMNIQSNSTIEYTVEIVDILGKIVDINRIVVFEGINTRDINISLLSMGYYTILLKDKSGNIVSTQPIIKN